MTFTVWKKWVRSKPWYMKWFILLIMTRPFIDALYDLKGISVYLSPLYWVGVLTPILCVLGMIYGKFIKSNNDNIFFGWTFVGFTAALVIFADNRAFLENVERFLRLSLPFFLFIFLRVFIRNKHDLHGVMITFLISCIPVFFIMLYELIITPIGMASARGGLIRYHGVYADILTYSIYIIVGFMFVGYFYLRRKKSRFDMKISTPAVLLMTFVCAIGLLQIKHNTSYALFATIFGLFLIYTFRHTFIRGIGIFTMVLISTLFVGSEIYDEVISPNIERELNVYIADQDHGHYLTGRVGRWESLLEDFQSVSLVSQLFGVNYEFGAYYYLTTGHVHSDYFRIMFFTGYIGFIMYLAWLMSLFFKIQFLDYTGRYLGYGALLVLLLYSVSTLPLFYPSLLYPLLSIFAYLSLPAKVLVCNKRV